jgi:hypothetical protein
MLFSLRYLGVIYFKNAAMTCMFNFVLFVKRSSKSLKPFI